MQQLSNKGNAHNQEKEKKKFHVFKRSRLLMPARELQNICYYCQVIHALVQHNIQNNFFLFLLIIFPQERQCIHMGTLLAWGTYLLLIASGQIGT